MRTYNDLSIGLEARDPFKLYMMFTLDAIHVRATKFSLKKMNREESSLEMKRKLSFR